MLIRYKDGVRLRRVSFPSVAGMLQRQHSLFLSNGMNVIKQQSANIVIGSFLAWERLHCMIWQIRFLRYRPF